MRRPTRQPAAVRATSATAAAVLLAAGSPAAAVTVASTFDSDVDGWTVNADGLGPTWLSADGKGIIEGRDDPVGESWFFVAPAKFLGDKSAFYGGTISFTLRQSNGNPVATPDPDVAIVPQASGPPGFRLVADVADPGSHWGTRSVPLIGGPGSPWRVGTADGPVATEEQVRGVLRVLGTLGIRGECEYGDDWARLDSVYLRTPTGLSGDTNDDGVVDLADLNNVLNHFGGPGAGNPGDDNFDGVVDLVDLNNVLNNFGASSAATALSVVPEPGTPLAAGLVALVVRCRRRRRT